MGVALVFEHHDAHDKPVMPRKRQRAHPDSMGATAGYAMAACAKFLEVR